MAKSNKKKDATPPVNKEDEKVLKARREADKDIHDDADMDLGKRHHKDDDLDEGELAKLDNAND